MLEQFLSSNDPSRLHLALKLLAPKGAPSPKLASTTQSTPLEGMLAKHKVTKIKETAQNSLMANGLPFEDATLQEMLWQLFITQQPKFKKDATHRYSIILDDHGTPYALFHGILGKGAYGKVKMAQNLLTQEFIAVKTIEEDISEPASAIERERNFLEKRKLLLGKQVRGTKHYLFMKLLPGISVCDFRYYLTECNITLSPRQQQHYLMALLRTQLSLMEDNIYHDDLHSGNVLIDPLHWEANIVDFGMAIDVSKDPDKESYFYDNLCRVLKRYKKAQITVPALQALSNELMNTPTGIVEAVKKALARLEAMDLSGELLLPSADPVPVNPTITKINLEDYRLLDHYLNQSIKILPFVDKSAFYKLLMPKININYQNEILPINQKIMPINYLSFSNKISYIKNDFLKNLNASEEANDWVLEFLNRKHKRAKI